MSTSREGSLVGREPDSDRRAEPAGQEPGRDSDAPNNRSTPWSAPTGEALTDEQIIDIRDEHLPSQGESFDTIAFARACIRAALATHPAPSASAPAHPAAWLRQYPCGTLGRDMTDSYWSEESARVDANRFGGEVFPVYTHPPAVQPVAPAGWKLVPVEPTPEMIHAAAKAESQHVLKDRRLGGNDPVLGFSAVYRAMLAATPSAEAQPTPKDAA